MNYYEIYSPVFILFLEVIALLFELVTQFHQTLRLLDIPLVARPFRLLHQTVYPLVKQRYLLLVLLRLLRRQRGTLPFAAQRQPLFALDYFPLNLTNHRCTESANNIIIITHPLCNFKLLTSIW